MKLQHNAVDLLACCNAIWQDGEVREVRTFPDAFTQYGVKKSGYFDNPQAVVDALKDEAGEEYESIYITLNPCRNDFLGRANNRLKRKPRAATKDEHITTARLLLIDVDPVRPSDLCSTDAEKVEAKAVMKAIIADLGEPLLLQDSGNGYHSIYKIDQQDAQARSKFLLALDAKHSNDKAKIDIAVFNASRVCKLAGTWSRKGDEIPERPHRICKIIRITPDSKTLHIPDLPPELVATVTLPAQQARAAQHTTTATARSTSDQQHNIELVRRFCDTNGVRVAREKSWNDSLMFQLEECVFNPDHAGNEACILVDHAGVIRYQCFHDGCKGRRWADVKSLYPVSELPASSKNADTGAAKAQLAAAAIAKTRYATQSDWNRLFKAQGWNFATDQLTWCVLLNRKRMEDSTWAQIRRAARDWLADNDLRRDMRDFEDAVYGAASQVIVNEIREYLDAARWDGVDRFTELASYFDTDLGVEKFARMLQVWFATSVRRIYEPSRGLCLVLQGSEELGKSRFAKWLCPLDPERFFIESDVRTEDKDCRMRCACTMIWELAELDKTIRKQDVSALKNFISQTSFKERKPWGKEDVQFQPVCNFIGTVNPDVFLIDQSGNSRFVVARVRQLCWDYERVDKDQLWAQAVVAYAEKKYVMTQDERLDRNEHNMEFTSKMTFEQYLDEALIKTDDNESVAITAVIDYLAEKKITFARNNELWNYLKTRGFERSRERIGADRQDSWQVIIKHARLLSAVAAAYTPAQTGAYQY